jgi:hypothetical protein
MAASRDSVLAEPESFPRVSFTCPQAVSPF